MMLKHLRFLQKKQKKVVKKIDIGRKDLLLYTSAQARAAIFEN